MYLEYFDFVIYCNSNEWVINCTLFSISNKASRIYQQFKFKRQNDVTRHVSVQLRLALVMSVLVCLFNSTFDSFSIIIQGKMVC